MPSGKMNRGICFAEVGVWLGRVAVSPGAMLERCSKIKEVVEEALAVSETKDEFDAYQRATN